MKLKAVVHNAAWRWIFSQSNEHEAHIPIRRKSAITGISQYVRINLGNLKLIKPAKLCSEVCCALDMTGYVYRKKKKRGHFFHSRWFILHMRTKEEPTRRPLYRSRISKTLMVPYGGKDENRSIYQNTTLVSWSPAWRTIEGVALQWQV